jgi:hypothetical protein
MSGLDSVHPNGRTDGRDARGSFTRGNVIGKGNAGNRRQRELRAALMEAATPEKVRAVEATLHELAVGGDTTACKVWLDHVVGRPVQAVELSGPDGTASGVEVLMTAVLAALSPYPEARLAVAAKLKGIPRGHDAGPGDRAGDPA